MIKHWNSPTCVIGTLQIGRNRVLADNDDSQ